VCYLGNVLGGGQLIGLHYAYVNDDAAYPRRRAAGSRQVSDEQSSGAAQGG